jgi:hypothetical protein
MNRSHPIRPVLLSLALVGLLSAASSTSATQWRENLEGVQIPKRQAEGSIHGQPFTVQDAQLQNGILTIRQGEDFFADLELIIFLFLDEGEGLEKRSFDVRREDGFGVPHVHMKYKVEGQDLPETEIFMDSYAMRLQFASVKEGKLTGRIYLSLPDESKSYVAGYFKAALEEESAVSEPQDVQQTSLEGSDEIDVGGPAGDAMETIELTPEDLAADLVSNLPMGAMVLVGIGGFLSLIGGIWFLAKAFGTSVLWGLGCMFVPFVGLIFLIMYFKDSYKPFLVAILGTVIAGGGMGYAGMTMQQQMMEAAPAIGVEMLEPEDTPPGMD